MGYSTYETTVWRFNKQIDGKCKRSFVDLELFKYSEQLTINDWREIRGKDFWTKCDSIEAPIDKNFFILQRVKQYLNGK